MKEKNKFITLKDLEKTILISIIVTVLFLSCFSFSIVVGNSMDRTLKNGDKLLISTVYYRIKEPKYKDIVIVKMKNLSVDYIVKRVIGKENDHIKIINNKLYINGKLIEEDYINEDMDTDNIEVIVPKGKIFVMGDNRNHSKDSRSDEIGCVDIKDIYGKEVCDLNKIL